jgi:GT2 family glycosyltransferase
MNITVIIPTKDRREYLMDILDDIGNQTIPVFEVIVSDQSENFVEIQDIYPYKLTHFKHHSKGPCSSRNDASEKAKGDILVFLDDDARIESNFIFEITKPIVQKSAFVCSGAICDINGKLNKKSHNSDFWFFQLTAIPITKYDNNCHYTPGCCFAIDKKVFFDIGKFDLFFDPNGAGEDREIAIRLVKNGYKIHFNSEAKLLHIGASSGGRRERKNTSIEFIKNIGYIIYTYYGMKKLRNYKFYLIKKRIKQILNFKSPLYNLQMCVIIMKNTKSKLYKSC